MQPSAISTLTLVQILLSPVIANRRILLSEGGNGLADEWSGKVAFVNPPYSSCLNGCVAHTINGPAGKVETVVCLVPIRTDSGWFHETLSADEDTYLLRGRVKFMDPRGKSQHTPLLADVGEPRRDD